MNFFVSSTIWLPVTTVVSIWSKPVPATLRNSSARRLTAPPEQFPQALQRPVQATFPASTGCVRL